MINVKFSWQIGRAIMYMIYKNDAILLRIHISSLCKLLGNLCSLKPSFHKVTPVQLLKLPINTHFLALSTQQQALTNFSGKLPRGLLLAISQ